MVVTKPEPKIEDGKQLVKVLDQKGLHPETVMWFYITESNVWRLIISTSAFNKQPSEKYYSDFVSKYKDLKPIKNIRLENVTLLPTTHALIKLLKFAVKTAPNSISGIRFTSNTINNVFIDDAYIYRNS